MWTTINAAQMLFLWGAIMGLIQIYQGRMDSLLSSALFLNTYHMQVHFADELVGAYLCHLPFSGCEKDLGTARQKW